MSPTEIEALTRRIEALERDSHPPIDLTPAIDEILDERGYQPTRQASIPLTQAKAGAQAEHKAPLSDAELSEFVMGAVYMWDDSEEWEGPCYRLGVNVSGLKRLREAVYG